MGITTYQWHASVWLSILLAALLAPASGSEVSGTVSTAGGARAEGAIVHFVSEDDQSVFTDTTDEEGRYRLVLAVPTALQEAEGARPGNSRLLQNYPNPFNPSTVIPYHLGESSRAKLEVFNSLGQRVRTLTDRWHERGFHTVSWDGRNDRGQGAATGVYSYRLSVGDFSDTRRMVLLDGGGPAASTKRANVQAFKSSAARRYLVRIDGFKLIPFEEGGVVVDGNTVIDFEVHEDLRQGVVFLKEGRKQLFLDSFALEEMDGVQRVQHQPRKYEGNPVIKPELPWELPSIQTREGPLWNPQLSRWELRYFSAQSATFLAVSTDGLNWEKPIVGRFEFEGSTDNNLVQPVGSTFIYHVLHDERDPDPRRRWKALIGERNPRPAASPDGFDWTFLSDLHIPSGEESYLFYDELSKQFVFMIRTALMRPWGHGQNVRAVNMSVSRDFVTWTDPVLVFEADERDQELGKDWLEQHLANPALRQPMVVERSDWNAQIYNMAAFPYEGIYIGLPTFYRQVGHNNSAPAGDGFSTTGLAVSRDLYTWQYALDETRPDFLPLSEVGENVFDTAQIEPPALPLRMGEELWFYYTALKYRYTAEEMDPESGAINLAQLRLDGFVSLNAGPEEGIVVTRPLVWRGSSLWVNADLTQGGTIQLEVLDENGDLIREELSRAQVIPVTNGAVRSRVRWRGMEDLRALNHQSVRLRFYLRNADLYAFWTE